MSEITYTLLSDGTSDKALLPIIEWTLQQHFPDLVVQRQWADLSRLPKPPKTLTERIEKAIELYPCDYLFVHRNAEKQSLVERQCEIEDAWRVVTKGVITQTMVGVIPVRMTEAWLLIDEQAIRTASGNRSGRQAINLPPTRSLETLPDPKQTLQQLLRDASGLNGHRLQKFNVSKAIQLVANNINNYSALKILKAYEIFEESIKKLPLNN